MPRRIVLVVLLAIGCASNRAPSEPGYAPLDAQNTGTGAEVDAATQYDERPRATPAAAAERKLIRTGSLRISLSDLEGIPEKVERIVTDAGGYVERSNVSRDSAVSLDCRVPAARLDRTMDEIAALGEEEQRSTSASDVTEAYADLETRLRNHSALRDRLQQLLKRADDVEDVLAIEKELNRVQTELERMQGSLDRMNSQVELSALSVRLEREMVLGPLGYLGYGLWWGISKLFVIR